jgi:RNA polymerase sigma factor (sigma-70 family)
VIPARTPARVSERHRPAVSVPKHEQKVTEHEATKAIGVGSETSADAALVRAAQTGDVRAFGELYERYRQPLYRYCLARSSSPHEAEDLVSEVFLKAMESLGRYRDQGLPFIAFLYRVARNAAIDRTRKDKGTSLFDMTAEPRSAVDVEGDVARASDMEAVLGDCARSSRSTARSSSCGSSRATARPTSRSCSTRPRRRSGTFNTVASSGCATS